MMRLTAVEISSGRRTSARSLMAVPPACSISSLVRSNSASVRASSPTLAPASAKPIARRFPMPRPAPVISTLFPWIESANLVLHFRVEDAGLNLPAAFHLHEDAIVAGLGESVGKRDGRRQRPI